MNTRVLRALRADAREWWYHQALRKEGNIAEAQQRERSSIRSAVRSLREAVGWYPSGDGCTTVVTRVEGSRVTGTLTCGGYRAGRHKAALVREFWPRLSRDFSSR